MPWFGHFRSKMNFMVSEDQIEKNHNERKIIIIIIINFVVVVVVVSLIITS